MPFPAPDYRGFDLSRYRRFERLVLPMELSRGCPWAKCRLCHRVETPFRERSPESITEEIAFQLKQPPYLEGLPRVIVQIFDDQLRGASTDRLVQLLDGLRRLKEQYLNQEMFCWRSPAHTTEGIMQRLNDLGAKVQRGSSSGAAVCWR